MNLINKLDAAEKLAGRYNRWQEFSTLYTLHRNQNKVMIAIEKTLSTMNLWEEYQQIIHR
jgi:hypothetical protein